MPTYLSPGVFVEEVPAGTQPIEGVGTSTGAFVGLAERGPTNTARLITNYTQFVNEFGRHITDSFLAYSVFSFSRKAAPVVTWFASRERRRRRRR